ncbi:unnamed protein product [Trichogramma brassicae]|uniref:Uncharacterized protein n=1 Tax=Trichogramma brassicae TaxID=86971 RepID=A0A6H5J644_9HYME|nr:unnamed protein product [Trichogramma brassicae]
MSSWYTCAARGKRCRASWSRSRTSDARPGGRSGRGRSLCNRLEHWTGRSVTLRECK